MGALRLHSAGPAATYPEKLGERWKGGPVYWRRFWTTQRKSNGKKEPLLANMYNCSPFPLGRRGLFLSDPDLDLTSLEGT